MQTLDVANLTLPQILLWLLTYAVVYGVLSQVGQGIPKSKAARSIIAIVSGFLVLMSNPTEILAVLSRMTGSMLLVLVGLLVFVVFIEMTHLGEQGIMKKSHISYILFIALVIIAAAIFVSAGGLELLGWQGAVMNISWNTIFFLIIIIAAIWWMVSSEGGEKGKE